MQFEPIGTVHSPFAEARGTPIQPRAAEGAEGTVEVFEPYIAGLADLDGFERIWLLYWFDRAAGARMTVTPFLDGQPRGLFATRAPCRPNPIGLSCVRLLRIEGGVLHVADIDVLDNTPLLDLKPYAPAFDSFDVARTGWLGESHARRRIQAT
ncbi:MAG: tRNA (N6-threonylcarbamoyladenosine(37)-N6)-methyltransferase TrmO, partial [Planctomycetota bacterium]